MKACLFALTALVFADLALDHGACLRAFEASVAGFGHAIGEWVFSTG
jgi:hypothetical protein